MIEISDYRLFGKDGILIRYDCDKEIFFTESETEKLRDFLNERKTRLRNRILTILESKKVTLGELIDELNIDRETINKGLMELEFEGRIEVEDKKVHHWDMGTVFIPLYKKKE